eukprot:4991304-Prymnesium_polylepis.1
MERRGGATGVSCPGCTGKAAVLWPIPWRRILLPRRRLSSLGVRASQSDSCLSCCVLLVSHRLVRGYMSACPDGHRPSRVPVVSIHFPQIKTLAASAAPSRRRSHESKRLRPWHG